jgi:two-component SAPR family response regulator
MNAKQQIERMRDIQSVTDAIDEVKRLVNWLEYIRENEFSDAEASRLVKSSLQFVKTAQPIASKYID